MPQCAALTRRLRPHSRLWLLPALAAAPVAAFFRDPVRDVPSDRRRSWPRATARSSRSSTPATTGSVAEFLRIAVFLSVLDVHVNRAPVAGRVVDHSSSTVVSRPR
jgi:phosphatidylserine decarboxylase